MQVTLFDNQKVEVTVAAVDGAGKPSAAALSQVNFASSDPTIVTVASDPATPLSGVVVAVKEGTATITVSATATEADNSQHVISGMADVTVSAAAASLVLTFGAPGPNH